MKHTNTGVDDREQWRAKIMRALQELQGEEPMRDGRLIRGENRDDTASESSNV